MGAATDQPLLLDNCAISACFEIGAWGALVARYDIHIVDEIASEAGTGYQHRPVIDQRVLREQVTIHPVTREQRLESQIDFRGLSALDDGERDLWIHALQRDDGWILCGPDIASIRFGVMAGHAERMVSLEELFDRIGYRPKRLKHHQTKKWLTDKIDEFSLEQKFASVSQTKKSR